MTLRSFIFIVSLLFTLNACSQMHKIDHSTGKIYDQQLAQSLGADDYGMRSYVLAILTTGPNDATITDEVKRKELFAGHFANMKKLAELKVLVVAGPLDGQLSRRGIFILNVETIADAENLVQTDPAIKAGIFSVELHKYYSSAGLMQVNDIHQQIQKDKSKPQRICC